MRCIALVAVALSAGWALESHADEPPSRWLWAGDTMGRNADLWTLSGMGALRLLGGDGRPALAVSARLRAGLGGGTVTAGIFGYGECAHVELPCLGLGVNAVALRTWNLSNWPLDTYFGGELRAQMGLFDATLGWLSADRHAPIRLQAGIGVGW
jgi:hypothetical protein